MLSSHRQFLFDISVFPYYPSFLLIGSRSQTFRNHGGDETATLTCYPELARHSGSSSELRNSHGTWFSSVTGLQNRIPQPLSVCRSPPKPKLGKPPLRSFDPRKRGSSAALSPMYASTGASPGRKASPPGRSEMQHPLRVLRERNFFHGNFRCGSGFVCHTALSKPSIGEDPRVLGTVGQKFRGGHRRPGRASREWRDP
jgi:hypothetical protein